MYIPSLASTFLSKRRTVMAATLVSFAAVLGGCASMSAPKTIADTLAETPSLSTLNGLVTAAGLTDTLKGAGPFTVFAPSNDAFKDVPAKTMDDLAKHPEKLKDVLTYHVLPVKALAADVKNSKVKTINGAEVELSKAGDIVTIENAVVTKADVLATNGVVHIIDTVLMPPVKK
jgi:uncharacterized surface protein with fasciclin (FAS1) repeats